MKRVIETSGAPPRSVPRCAMRSLRISPASERPVSASTSSIVVFSRDRAIRAPGRPALHPRQAPQPLHRNQLPRVDDRDLCRRLGADRGAFGDERLPEGSPHPHPRRDRKSTRLNSSHSQISYAVFCLKKKNKPQQARCPLELYTSSRPFVTYTRAPVPLPTKDADSLSRTRRPHTPFGDRPSRDACLY